MENLITSIIDDWNYFKLKITITSDKNLFQ